MYSSWFLLESPVYFVYSSGTNDLPHAHLHEAANGSLQVPSHYTYSWKSHLWELFLFSIIIILSWSCFTYFSRAIAFDYVYLFIITSPCLAYVSWIAELELIRKLASHMLFWQFWFSFFFGSSFHVYPTLTPLCLIFMSLLFMHHLNLSTMLMHHISLHLVTSIRSLLVCIIIFRFTFPFL